ncbi:MAG TPA: apolipoprotein N-acyltransferase [Longimicrobiales bacterium]|nr:apolipoprotein N-acyltransferase [Longimicrobiales bacterium]
MTLASAVRRAGRAFVPPRGHRLLPLLSALLLVMSFPPVRLLAPPFIALVPFLLYLAELPAEPASRWAAVRAGYLLGLVYFGLLLYWLIVALIYYTPLAILAFTLTVLVLAGFTATFAWGVVYLRERLGAVPLAVAAAVLWTALEWLQGHLGDLSFPWLGLGSALSSFPRVAGAADLVGARGLTFWLVLVNGLVAETILAVRRRRAPVRLASLAVVAVALPVAYGFWRAATLEPRPAARVAVIQPNIPEDLKMDRLRAVDSSMTALIDLTSRVPPGSVDLVVWPEVALPLLITAPDAAGVSARVQQLARAVRAPIVVGAYGYEWDPAQAQPTIYNSAFLMTPDGISGATYSKQYLVPFVERIPFIDPAALERFTGPLQWFGGLGHGRSTDLYGAADGSRFGIAICYESIFAPLARVYRQEGAAFLVNMTNDSWYGREPWYSRTSALWQHPAHLVMRALETRVGIARSANTGISMFIDPLGRTYQETPLFRPELRIATVYTTDGLTLFVRWGDWLATGAAAAALLLLVAARVLGRPRVPAPARRRAAAAPPAA